MRVVNQLLTEMDGLESRRQVFIMAATNRPGVQNPLLKEPVLKIYPTMSFINALCGVQLVLFSVLYWSQLLSLLPYISG